MSTECTVCSLPLSYDDGTGMHPTCRTVEPLTEAEHGRLLAALTDLLCATPMPCWRVSGEPLPGVLR